MAILKPLTPFIQKLLNATKKLRVTFVAFFMRNHLDPNNKTKVVEWTV